MNRKGFSLVEMLVVIGIIAVLMGATVGGYARFTASAEKARCRELVANTATALAVMYQDKGAWPRLLKAGAALGELNENVALPLKEYMSLSSNGGKLSGVDCFGIVSPWAMNVIKHRGVKANVSDKVPSGGTIKDHILHYAIDLDGDGIIDDANIGGETVSIRATAAVWCCGKDGKLEAYSVGLRKDDIYSWTHGQTKYVK